MEINITISGVTASGKTTMVLLLQNHLESIFGPDSVKISDEPADEKDVLLKKVSISKYIDTLRRKGITFKLETQNLARQTSVARDAYGRAKSPYDLNDSPLARRR